MAAPNGSPRLELTINPAPTTPEGYRLVAQRLMAELNPEQFEVLLVLALALEAVAPIPSLARAAHFLTE